MRTLTLLLLLISTTAMAQLQYVSPKPGATLINPEHSIIIRDGRFIDPASLDHNLYTVTGSKSGLHSFRVVLSSDDKTVILYPDQPFAYDEEVVVTIGRGMRTLEGRTVEPYSFSFTTHREYTAAEKETFRNLKPILQQQEFERWGVPQQQEPTADTRLQEGSFTILVNTDPSPGVIFYDAWNSSFGSTKYDGYNIITNDGDSLFQSGKESSCFDFSVNPSGYLSVYDGGHFDILDSNHVIIDSWYPANGRTGDPHEFTMFEDGHAVMVVEEFHFVDMDDYTDNYHQNATLMNTGIQEFDADKNMIFEWRSWDNVDVEESNQNLGFSYIDVVHTNSIELDEDGNIIASHRHLDQITKIDRNTGAFIWRLGGDLNEFTFINDAEKFNYQHDARRIDNGNITVWDNGNLHAPTHSSAKEYELDEVNMTATLVWSFQPKTYTNTNAYFFAMGSAQRLENGNTLANGGWDASSNQSNMWEVTPDGEVVWELALDNSTSLVGYRALKFNWNPCAPVNDDLILVKKITDSSAKVIWQPVANAASYDIQWRRADKTAWKTKNTTNTSRKLNNLVANKDYVFQVRTNCLNGRTSDWTPIDTFHTLPLRLAEPEKPLLTFELSPNPTSGFLNIDFALQNAGDMTISIYDLAGKELMNSTSQFAAGDQSLHFDLGNFQSGCYLVEIITGSQHETVKLIKQ